MSSMSPLLKSGRTLQLPDFLGLKGRTPPALEDRIHQ